MSVLRQDPLTGEWVVLTPGRGRRPHAVVANEVPADRTDCPFCPGSEDSTPPEIARAADAAGDWLVRVVPNRFPILDRAGGPSDETLFVSRPATGAHEVIIEARGHGADLATMMSDQLERVVSMYVHRVAALGREKECRHVVLFKNRGAAAGASLSHPHSQVVASSVVPERAARQLERSRRYFRGTRRCLLCDVIRAERAAGKRWIEKQEDYAAWAPHAARFPFAMRLVSLNHDESFEQLRRPAAFAALLQRSLQRMRGVLGNVAYNLILDLPPRSLGGRRASVGAEHPWYMEVVPRATWIAGYELGTGISVNLVAPEEAAGMLRAVTL